MKRSGLAATSILPVSLAAILLAACASRCQAQDLTLLEEESIQQVVENASSYVVRIETVGGLDSAADTGGAGPTSGVIVDAEGYIVASAYPFAKLPSAVLVTLPDGQRSPAKVVATDDSRNLVLLKVETEKLLTIAPAAPRKDLRVGQWGIAVGRVYSTANLNVSTGIISATDRIWGRAVQTDAKISPANYGGALLDIHGRVIGVLTPMSPRGSGAASGAEWYDSGIGFAAHMSDIYNNLDRWKKGDLQRGVLGAVFTKDMYSKPAKVEAVRPKSPALDAGLQVGDTVVEANGRKIQRMAQFRHAMGPLYAGDELRLLVSRGEPAKQVELKATLVDKLVPYEHPFLGVLPRRDSAAVNVRWVYPDSPAAKAGIEAGDRITAIDGKPAGTVDLAHQRLAAFEPKGEAEVEYERDGEKRTAKIVFTSLPTAAPAPLPLAQEQPTNPPNLGGVDLGFFDVLIPEEASECKAYVPFTYDPRVSNGLLVVLGRPGADGEDLLEPWRLLADEHNMVLLAPASANAARWSAADVDFVIKTIESVTQTYTIDPLRIAIYGQTSGAAVGHLVIGKRRDLIRGLIQFNGSLPRRAAPPENEPLQRLAFYSITTANAPSRMATEALEKALRERKFPVHSEVSGDQLTAETRTGLIRWLDSLDRL